MNLAELGMLEPMQVKLKQGLNHGGIVIISAPPQMGLTSTWRAALAAADRMTRDCVAVAVEGENETEMENLECKRYAPGQSPATAMRPVLLKQPNMIVVPDLVNPQSLEILVEEANEHDRSITLRASAQGAAEALHKMFHFATEKEDFLKAARMVTGQRLLRRLCESCRVSVQVRGEIIQRLGGDPRKQNNLWNPFVPPPADQPVMGPDGKPIVITPCPKCNGLGYFGRIAAFELLEVTDPLRKALLSGMPAAKLELLAQQQGFETMLQSAYKMVLYGVTSMAEVQRIFKPADAAKPVARKS
jgi:type II secretory ATPase GspE/PulE/Tfp pilus assembly ATPase PilB-like protein